MKEWIKNNGLSRARLAMTGAICAFGLLSIIYVALTTNKVFSYFYCIATVGFALLPVALTVIFRWKMNLLFYSFFSLYTIGPLLGAVYNFYYMTSWFDDLLHGMAGVVFAVIGAYFFTALNKGQKGSLAAVTLFGFLFSIGIAVFWEIYEFGADMLLGSDMQADTVIGSFSTKIGMTNGETFLYKDITETLVNGTSLGVNGYIDIGLIDTMTDLIVETLGALVFVIYVIIDRDRHPLITRFERVKKAKATAAEGGDKA